MKKNKLSLAVIALFVTFLSVSMTFAASDNILSANIKEADGTSGQNTNAGSGVKTGHIQDGAVTANKITDSAVTTNKVADGAVTTPKLADGAVTDAKITGPISASKISSTGLNADTVDGMHATDLAPVVHTHNQADVSGLTSALAGKADVNHNHDNMYQKKYANVIVVARSGGDFTDPVAAMNDLVAWCETPSASNPCLLKIMPGVYDIGVNNLRMESFVDIEGAGEQSTKILGRTNSGPFWDNGVVIAWGGVGSEIRFLTIENSGGAEVLNSVAMSNVNSAPRITNVTVIASGGSSQDIGIANLWSSPAVLTNLTAYVGGGANGNVGVANLGANQPAALIRNAVIDAPAGTAIWNSCAAPVIMNLTATNPAQDYAVWSTCLTSNVGVRIFNSVISGLINSVSQITSGTTYVANTNIASGSAFGTVLCAGVTDGSLAFYTNTCP